jgi:prevent-host-death family protein
MRQVNLYEAKTSLSALVDEAAAGEEIIIAKNGKAKARLVAVEPPRERPPPNFGFWNHLGWTPPADFDDPDPEIEALFYGDGTV